MSLKKLILLGQEMSRTANSKVNHTMQIVSVKKNGSVKSGTSSTSIRVRLDVALNNLKCLNSGNVSKQKMTIDSKMTTTEMMATTRAACELSGYSNSSQILRFHSLTGRGRSSSLMKPSSSLSSIRVSQSATTSSSHPPPTHKKLGYRHTSLHSCPFQPIHPAEKKKKKTNSRTNSSAIQQRRQ